jgi:hypothetical protein
LEAPLNPLSLAINATGRKTREEEATAASRGISPQLCFALLARRVLVDLI